MKFLLPALTVLLSSTNAFAAGYDWSGAYLGGQMGYASGTSAIAAISMSSSSSARMDSGRHLRGYNHQFSNNMVLGLDADFSLANIKNNGKYYDGGIRYPEVGTSIKMRWNGAARIRAGYAVDRLLPYVAAGLSMGNTSCRSGMRRQHAGCIEDAHGLDHRRGPGLRRDRQSDRARRISLLRFRQGQDFQRRVRFLSFKTHDVRLGIAYKF